METDGTPQPAQSASFANAYAVTYRLLGDRGIATELSTSIAERYGPSESEPADRWLPDVVHDAVAASLALEGELARELAAADSASMREALRRRLGGADDATRVAVGLHELAGYPVDVTAGLMSFDADEVASMCGPYAAPPGSSWAELGDPVNRAAGGIKRAQRTPRRVPVFAIVAVLAVVALAIWAGTSIGERPSVGEGGGAAQGASASSEGGGSGAAGAGATGAAFEPTLDPLPSAGCGVPPPQGVQPGTPVALEFDVQGRPLPYRLLFPAAAEPAPLVIAVADDATDPAAFAAQTRLEEALPGSIHVTIPPLIPEGRPVGSEAVPALLDKLVSEHCVDLARTFVVGHGVGGAVAAEAACSAPELIVGAAAVASAPTPDSCVLDPAVAIMVSSRDDDPTVDPGEALSGNAAAWAAVLDADDEVVDAPDERTLVRTYEGPGGVTVMTISRTEGGHGWNSLDTGDVVDFVAGTARMLS